MSFFTCERDKNWLAEQTEQKHLDNLAIITKEYSYVGWFNPDHAIIAWYREKMWQDGGEISLNIQQRVQEQTGKINLARVALSDLENDRQWW